MASDWEPDTMGLEQLVGEQVVVRVPGHSVLMTCTGMLRLDRNPDGTLRALTLLKSDGGLSIAVAWGAGVTIHPAP